MSSDMLSSHLSSITNEVNSLVDQISNKNSDIKKNKKVKQLSKIDNAKKIITKNKKALEEAVNLMSSKKNSKTRNDKLRVIKVQRNYKTKSTFK